MLKTPILLIIFNRPDTTQKVFASIREVKPKYLFIAADGPRPDRPDDQEKCTQARKAVENIDWDCEVKYLFRNENLGCGIGPSNAITWFFEHVEEGIILEDDCLPSPDFFTFCEEMLSKYRDHPEISHINGSCLISPELLEHSKADYYISSYPLIWGWASWRRAWQYYKYDLSSVPINFNSNVFGKNQRNYWLKSIQYFQNNPIDAWDLQWSFTLWQRGKKSISPVKNLIKNIGFRPDATHTREENKFLIRELEEMHPPFVKPVSFEVRYDLDAYLFQNSYYQWRSKTWIEKTINYIKHYLSKGYKAVF